jgi:hypothetical protein
VAALCLSYAYSALKKFCPLILYFQIFQSLNKEMWEQNTKGMQTECCSGHFKTPVYMKMDSSVRVYISFTDSRLRVAVNRIFYESLHTLKHLNAKSVWL